LVCACQAPTHFTVNDTADAVDASPGDGVCATAANTCTLRAAVQEANADPDQDVIDLQAGATYQLDLSILDEDAAAAGDLDVNEPLVIEGHGATVQGDQNQQFGGTQDRVFDNRSHLELHDLTVQFGGSTSASPSPFGAGVRNAGDLLVEGSHVTTNAGDDILQTAGSLVVVSSQIDNGPNAGIEVQAGAAVIAASAVVDNVGHPFFFSNPGSLYQTGGDVQVVESTIGGETGTFTNPSPACLPPCLVNVSAPAILHAGGTLHITGSTLYGSQQSVRNTVTGDVTVAGSVLLDGCNEHVDSGGYNVDEIGTCVSGTVATDHRSIITMMDGLTPGTNGGTTTNLLPPVGSPVIDLIPAGTVGLCDSSVPTDQRGLPRPANGACDAGSVEVQPAS
jgi:CSLREA domain-containing protein